jgi:hypothetical protein
MLVRVATELSEFFDVSHHVSFHFTKPDPVAHDQTRLRHTIYPNSIHVGSPLGA